MAFRVLLSCAVLVMAAGNAAAETADRFGRADGVNRPSLSPSGNLLAVECAPKGVPSICIFDIANGGESRFIPIGNGYRLEGAYWPNEDYLLINVSQFDTLQTSNGLKDYNFLRAISYSLETGEATLLMRDEAQFLDTQSVVSVLPDDPRNVLLTGMVPNTSRNTWTLGTYKADLKTGKSRRRATYSPTVLAVYYDVDGEEVAEIVRANQAYCGQVDKTACSGSDSTALQLRAGGKVLRDYDSGGVNTFEVIGLDQTTGKLIIWQDIGDVDGLHYMSLETGQTEPIMLGGEAVGRVAAVRDSYTRGIVGFGYNDGLAGQHFLDPALKAAHEQLDGVLPGQRITFGSWNRAKTKIVVRAEAPGHPAMFYVFDTTSGQLGPVGSQASHLADVTAGEVRPQAITMRDGFEAEAILTLPPGRTLEDGPFPTVVMPHGGPEARDTLAFDWWAQAYAADGYLVIQPNFRGSSGYGQAYRNAGFGEFGGKMIDDVVDAGAWAVSNGYAAENAYCVVGASYGGYASLMTAIRDPEHARCAISVNGLTEPFSFVGRFSPDSETAQYWERYLGSNRFSSAEVRDAIAPLARASELTMPVMLMYGDEDLTVPTDQSKRLASRLEGKSSLDVVSLGAQDHYLRSSFVRQKLLEDSLGFLQKYHPARQ